MQITEGVEVIITSGFARNMSATVEVVIPAREIEPGYFSDPAARVYLPGYGHRVMPLAIMEPLTR